MTPQYEKLGAFYLGKEYDLATGARRPDLVLYDAKDLTTHAIIIGMTGSGKTGLGLGIIEEALIDHIPVIAIDPKGDLPNLLLTFPDLKPADFEPWIDPREAATQGMTPVQYAAQKARDWATGLADWDQAPERIARLRAAADWAVYTPGGTAGVPVCVLRDFSPPPPPIMEDLELLRDHVQSMTQSLLGLLGIEADPLASREHILLASIFESAWSEGRTLDLAGLIQSVQTPPFERVGVMNLEMFFPSHDRFALAMRLNNLLAAPGFESWMTGEPLDIGRLLHTDQGKPRASIFTISHLSDSQRMFFVSMLLNRILTWLRTQPGTASLRAILYMDEIFGYFPPVSNPPSKTPLLTLLKQARAFGLGIVLSTQNPVDLDYKGLANTGTWFIGRLQTERDKERVLSGLEGAGAAGGFDRGRMAEVLAGLGKRVFLLHNVHDSEPVIFQTRWLLSYLSGPMTREQIKRLTRSPVTQELLSPTAQPSAPPPVGRTMGVSKAAATPTAAPPGVDVFYLAASGAGTGLVYRPALVGRMDIRYADARNGVDLVKTLALAAELQDGPVPLDWDQAVEVDAGFLETDPFAGAEYGALPVAAQKPAAFGKWQKDLLRWVRQHRPLNLYQCSRLKMVGEPDEPEGRFRARLAQTMREARDREVEKLRIKYANRFAKLKERLMLAEQAVEREADQVKSRKMETAISFGSAILGAFLGRKVVSASSASRVGTAMRSASRIEKESMDVARASERAEAIRGQLADLDQKLQDDIDAIDTTLNPESIDLETIAVHPKSTDITLELFGLAWLPYRRSADGRIGPDWNR